MGICPEQEARHLFNNIPESVCKYYVDVTNATHCHWLNADLITSVCADGEKDLCAVLHPNNNITISGKKQLSIGSQYMQLFLTATLVDENNKDDFGKIANQLN